MAAITKKEFIEKLMSLEVPDDTIVVKSSGIGFEDIYDVRTQNICFSSFSEEGEGEFPAIILD